MLAIFFTIEHEQVLHTHLNNSEIRYTKKLSIFLTGGTHPTHLVCLRHWRDA